MELVDMKFQSCKLSWVAFIYRGEAMVVRLRHEDTVKAILNAKAVDFTALGKIIAEIGPSIATAQEPWEDICGTGWHFVRVFHLPPIGLPGTQIADLGALRQVAGELKG